MLLYSVRLRRRSDDRPGIAHGRGHDRVEPGVQGSPARPCLGEARPPAACSPSAVRSATRSKSVACSASGSLSAKPSRTTPPSAAMVSWQLKQYRSRIGATSREKTTVRGVGWTVTAVLPVSTSVTSGAAAVAESAGWAGGGVSSTGPQPAQTASAQLADRSLLIVLLILLRNAQYWSALMISPPARVTRAAMNGTDATSLRKWTDPSAKSALAPPGWNE